MEGWLQVSVSPPWCGHPTKDWWGLKPLALCFPHTSNSHQLLLAMTAKPESRGCQARREPSTFAFGQLRLSPLVPSLLILIDATTRLGLWHQAGSTCP